MQGKTYSKRSLRFLVVTGILFVCSISGRGQEVQSAASSGSSASDTSVTPAEIRALSDLIRGLQAQVQTLNSQLGDVRMEQERASAEASELRHELDLVKRQGGIAPSGPLNSYSAPPAKEIAGQPALSSTPTPQQPQTVEDRFGKLEEDQQVMDGKINDQYQTKVESGSKYRLRLSGIVLLNLFENRGTVDNLDFPEVAGSLQANEPNASPGAFGGTASPISNQAPGFWPGCRRRTHERRCEFGLRRRISKCPEWRLDGTRSDAYRHSALRLDQYFHRRRAGPFVFCSPCSHIARDTCYSLAFLCWEFVGLGATSAHRAPHRFVRRFQDFHSGRDSR